MLLSAILAILQLYHGDNKLNIDRTNGIRIVLTGSVIDHEFHPRSGQTEDNKVVVCCFSAALRDKNKYV
jgi:hypothetical protein